MELTDLDFRHKFVIDNRVFAQTYFGRQIFVRKKTETENGPRFDTTKIMLRKFIFVVFLSYLGHH